MAVRNKVKVLIFREIRVFEARRVILYAPEARVDLD